METKKEIRKKIRNLRMEMDSTVWKRNTELLTAAVTSHPWFREADDIYSYIDYQGEVGTRRILKEAWRLGKNVWVPRILGEKMVFCHINSLEELHPGTYGIPEPDTNRIADGRDGLMIVPGIAFDCACHRVGYGGGYYDRYLSEHPSLHTIAIAFDFQIFQEVPHEIFDICPELLITENRICRREQKRSEI